MCRQTLVYRATPLLGLSPGCTLPAWPDGLAQPVRFRYTSLSESPGIDEVSHSAGHRRRPAVSSRSHQDLCPGSAGSRLHSLADPIGSGDGVWSRYPARCRWYLFRGGGRRPHRRVRWLEPAQDALRGDSLLDPVHDAAKIRAFFVHPKWTRRGIGSMILEVCEAEAIAAGFKRLEMGATLTGVPLYRARGYVALENLEVPLPAHQSLSIVRMEKRL
jgi:GNAT superfamily N-acetyltransferase